VPKQVCCWFVTMQFCIIYLVLCWGITLQKSWHCPWGKVVHVCSTNFQSFSLSKWWSSFKHVCALWVIKTITILIIATNHEYLRDYCQRSYYPTTFWRFPFRHLSTLNTSSAGCLETCPSTGCWPTVYTWLAYNILVLHFKCQPLSAGSYVFLYKVRTFRTSL